MVVSDISGASHLMRGLTSTDPKSMIPPDDIPKFESECSEDALRGQGASLRASDRVPDGHLGHVNFALSPPINYDNATIRASGPKR
jgi:hypothetical protein